jgi:hypothetical protein
MRYAFLLLAAWGCVPATASITHSANGAASPREQFQTLIDAACDAPDGGTVVVPPGRWPIDRAPVGSRNRFSGVSFGAGCRVISLRGEGPESVLEQVGDLGGIATWLVSVDPGSGGIEISNVTLAITASNTGEQTHAISTSGLCDGAGCAPIAGLTIKNVRFDWPYTGETRSGDCIRLLGNSPETALRGVRIIDNDFVECARSAIGVNGIVDGLNISDNDIQASRPDQLIDFEGTGGRRARNAIVANNVLRSGPGAQGAWDVTLSRSDGVVFSGNTLSRGVQVFGNTLTSVIGNTFDVASKNGDAVIEVRNECDGNNVSGNTIRRTGAAGPLIHAYPHTNRCRSLSIGPNTLIQDTNSPAIVAESVSGLSIAKNQITYSSPAPGKSAIHIKTNRPAWPVSVVSISANTVLGSPTYAVLFEAYPLTASFGRAISVSGNVADGTVFGLRLDGGPANFTAPIISRGNDMGAQALGGNAVAAGD